MNAPLKLISESASPEHKVKLAGGFELGRDEARPYQTIRFVCFCADLLFYLQQTKASALQA